MMGHKITLKWNEIKWDQMRSNEMKWDETKWNKRKEQETGWSAHVFVCSMEVCYVCRYNEMWKSWLWIPQPLCRM